MIGFYFLIIVNVGSRFAVSSTCVLFISLMQLINRSKFLNITFLFLLFGAAAAPVLGLL